MAFVGACLLGLIGILELVSPPSPRLPLSPTHTAPLHLDPYLPLRVAPVSNSLEPNFALRLPFGALSGQLAPLGRNLKSNLTSTQRSSAMGDRTLCCPTTCIVVKADSASSASPLWVWVLPINSICAASACSVDHSVGLGIRSYCSNSLGCAG